MKLILGTLLGLMLAGTASADTVWTYDGNSTSRPDSGLPPNPCACSLDGTILFADNGSVLAWNWTDGTHTLTNANSTAFFNPHGSQGITVPFIEWTVRVIGAGWTFSTVNYGSGFEETDIVFPNGGKRLHVRSRQSRHLD